MKKRARQMRAYTFFLHFTVHSGQYAMRMGRLNLHGRRCTLCDGGKRNGSNAPTRFISADYSATMLFSTDAYDISF
jgi:hypothetical protein